MKMEFAVDQSYSGLQTEFDRWPRWRSSRRRLPKNHRKTLKRKLMRTTKTYVSKVSLDYV
jgi:hypothetical protein